MSGYYLAVMLWWGYAGGTVMIPQESYESCVAEQDRLNKFRQAVAACVKGVRK